MTLFWFLVFFVGIPVAVWESRQEKQKRAIIRAEAQNVACPHCHAAGPRIRQDILGVLCIYIGILKFVSFGLLALLFPAWHFRCENCRHRFRRTIGGNIRSV